MNRRIAGLLGAIAFALATPLYAQATRTWVSGVGDDLNPCSRTAPCKTFAGAISKTATGGEINCLDPAGYGSVNITKAITIDCNWTHGSILAANFNGVIVNAPATASVTLRGLSINGAGTTTGNGVRILAARDVLIDDLVIENFGGNTLTNGRGVAIDTGANIQVAIQNTRFNNITSLGIHSNPTAGTVTLSIDGVQITRGGTTAIQFRQFTNGRVNNTSVTNHPVGAAITVELTNNQATVSNSYFANNAFGIFNGNAGGTPTTRVFGTVITGNTSDGILINGGQVISSGNNIIRGNGGNEAPSSNAGTQ